MTENDNTSGAQQPENGGNEQRRGSMRFQDAATTTPREPTVAEQRARRKALAEEEERAAQLAVAERKSATKRKVLVGTGVTVGLVGLVAGWYLAATPDEVNATCTMNGVVQPEERCDDNYVRNNGGHYDHVSGMWIMPLFIGGPMGQYRYNYGGSGAVGSPVSGGSYNKPPGNTKVTTNSGKTVQRGGLGISNKGGSGGSGKSGGS